MHMATSVSVRLNILCIMLKIIAFFITMPHPVTCESWNFNSHVENTCMTPSFHLRGEVWVHQPSLTNAMSLFIEVPVSSSIDMFKSKNDFYTFLQKQIIMPMFSVSLHFYHL